MGLAAGPAAKTIPADVLLRHILFTAPPAVSLLSPAHPLSILPAKRHISTVSLDISNAKKTSFYRIFYSAPDPVSGVCGVSGVSGAAGAAAGPAGTGAAGSAGTGAAGS